MSGIVGQNLGRGSGLVKAGAIDDNAVTLAKMAGLARGKLIYGDASGDPAALAVGGADEVLTHDGTDFDWAAASGGGKILQVVRSTNSGNSYTTTSTSPQLAFISATLTLASSSNKVWVCFTYLEYFYDYGVRSALYRSPTASAGTTIDGGTKLTTGTEPQTYSQDAGGEYHRVTLQTLDTPAVTNPFYGVGFWEHASNTGNSNISTNMQIAEMTMFEVEV